MKKRFNPHAPQLSTLHELFEGEDNPLSLSKIEEKAKKIADKARDQVCFTQSFLPAESAMEHARAWWSGGTAQLSAFLLENPICHDHPTYCEKVYIGALGLESARSEYPCDV